MKSPRTQLLFVLVALFAPVLSVPVSGQLAIDANPGSSIRTREDLQHLLESYEQVLESPAYSDAVKDDVRARASRIRDRLSNGDFKLGDRVVLSVEGEPTLPDTLPVVSSETGPRIILPLFGDISLSGVLRSEVQETVRLALAKFIRDPVVRAEGLMRISVQGAVGRPGFYLVPANILLSEALMVAGGPAASSNLDGMRIERGREILFSGEALQEEIRQGRTLDQLNLQAGDQLSLPAQGTGRFFSNVGVIVGLVSSVSFLIFQFAR